MSSDKTVTFGIKIPVDTDAGKATNSIDDLRSSVAKSQDVIKAYSSSLKSLKGDSDAVTDAKLKLKAGIDAEKNSISQSVLALGKLGETLKEVGKASKLAKANDSPIAKLTEDLKSIGKTTDTASKGMSGLGAGIKAVGGPVGTLLEKIKGLGESFKGVPLRVALAGAALAAFAGITIYAGVQLTKFIIESGNVARSQDLLREATSGSAKNAKAWGEQIADMSRRVPLTVQELNDLTTQLDRTFSNSQITGSAVVDLANAMGQVSAQGEGAAAKLQTIVEKGKNFGSITLGVDELGTALGTNGFQKIAAQLAKDMGKSQQEIQSQLQTVGVDSAKFAKALRTSTEKEFGAINMKKMLDLDFQAKRFKDTLGALTEGVNLELILKPIAEIAKLFDTSTVTGAALKDMITDFGNAVGKVFTAATPFVTGFFEEMIIIGLQAEIFLIKLKNTIDDTFGENFLATFTDAEAGVMTAKTAFIVLAGVVGALAIEFAVMAAPVLFFIGLLATIVTSAKYVFDFFSSGEAKRAGEFLVDGLVAGITGGIDKVKNAVGAVAGTVKNTFKNLLGIRSPSKLFEEFGDYTVQGYADGINGNKSKAVSAVQNMAGDVAQAGAAASDTGVIGSNTMQKLAGGSSNASSGNAPMSATISFNFPNVTDGEGMKAAVSSSGFRAQFTKLLEEVAMGSGSPIQTASVT